MFAIFYVMTVTVCKVISGTKNAIKNQAFRNEAYNNNKIGYWDTNGAYKDPETDEQLHYETLRNGDRVIKKLNGEVVKNISKEQRDSFIKIRNAEFNRNGKSIKLLGKFEDICPDKVNQGIWRHVPKRTAVYVTNNGNLYFRQPTCGLTTPENVYIKVDNGEFVFLDKANDEDIKWLEKNNYGLNNNIRTFIALSKLADRVI